MKSDSSIRNICLAAIKRHSADYNDWTGTSISVDQFPGEVQPQSSELPIVYFTADNDNWTLITTRRIIGSIDAEKEEVRFDELFMTLWGNYRQNKDNPIDTTTFRVIDRNGVRHEFLMETGNPSIAFVYGIKTVEGFYKPENRGQIRNEINSL